MSNLLLGWPVYSDASVLYTPTLSGGSWSASLPLTNLQDRRLSKVARSASAAITSTQFDLDLKVTRTVGLFAIPKHTLSAAATIRVRGFTSLPILSALDFSTGWSAVGTPTRSGAAFTASDGVPMDLIGDDTAAALEGYTRVVTFTGAAAKVIAVRVKQGTSTSSVVRVRDTSAPADRLLATITWSGGVPSAAFSTGSLVSSTLVATGVYRMVFLTSAVTPANTNQVEVYPATSAALAIANTGDLYVSTVEAYDATTEQLIYDAGTVRPYPSGLTAEDVVGLNLPVVIIPATAQSARYWRTEITDTANTAGYVDLARLIVAGAYTPAINANFGAVLGLETETQRLVTDGGAALYNTRPLRRTLDFVLDNIAEAEAFDSFWRMSKQLGTASQLFVCYDPADTARKHDRQFLAVFRKPSALVNTWVARYQGGVSLVEEL